MSRLYSGKRILGLAALWMLTIGVNAAAAAIITLDGSVTAISDNPSAGIAQGDQFSFSLSFDDQTLDTQIGNIGVFTDAVTTLEVFAGAGNAGTWSPNGAVAVDRSFIQVRDARFLFSIFGTGPPDIAGLPFWAVGLQFAPIAGINTAPGTGTTLADALGGQLVDDLGAYDLEIFLALNEDEEGLQGQITSLAVTADADVPEPSTMILFGTSLLGLAAWRRRRT